MEVRHKRGNSTKRESLRSEEESVFVEYYKTLLGFVRPSSFLVSRFIFEFLRVSTLSLCFLLYF